MTNTTQERFRNNTIGFITADMNFGIQKIGDHDGDSGLMNLNNQLTKAAADYFFANREGWRIPYRICKHVIALTSRK